MVCGWRVVRCCPPNSSSGQPASRRRSSSKPWDSKRTAFTSSSCGARFADEIANDLSDLAPEWAVEAYVGTR